MTSVRHFLKQIKGRTAFNHNIGGIAITDRTVFVVTAAPCSLGTGFFDPDIRLNVHGPDVRVSNVVAHGPEGGDGGVEFVLTVDSATPVDVAVTITALDPWETFSIS